MQEDGAVPAPPLGRGSGVGRSHGTSKHQPFDRWFRYPAGFASDYVSRLLDEAEVRAGTVLDCFAGSAVTGTAARARGLDFVGIEAHPMMADLADLKLTGEVDAVTLRTSIREAAAAAAAGQPADAEAETELVQRSFDSETLQQLIALRSYVQQTPPGDTARLMKWALLATLRDVASVKVGWPYQRPGVARRARYTGTAARFSLRCESMLADLEGLGQRNTKSKVILGDASDQVSWSGVQEPLAACITSPPYLNNFDYADATRLELYFWGHVRTWKEMCDGIRHDMLTATTQQSSRTEMAAAEGHLEAINSDPTREVLELAQAIRSERKARDRRTKEYDQVTAPYFLAMRRILENAHPKLAEGAPLKWLIGDSAPYGIYVDTPRIIGDLAEGVGYAFEKDVSLRDRGKRWTQNNERHSHPLSERLITLRRL